MFKRPSQQPGLEADLNLSKIYIFFGRYEYDIHAERKMWDAVLLFTQPTVIKIRVAFSPSAMGVVKCSDFYQVQQRLKAKYDKLLCKYPLVRQFLQGLHLSCRNVKDLH